MTVLATIADRLFGHGKRMTALGVPSGALLVDDGLRQVVERPDDWTAWVRFVVGLLTVIAGALMKDTATPKAPVPPNVARNRIGGSAAAELLALLAAALVLVLLLITYAGATNVLHYTVDVTNTPAVVGNAQGRGFLEIAAKTAAPNAVSCGPCDQPSTAWWPLAPGGTAKQWGIVYRGQYTAEERICCVAPDGTPHPIAVAEEGNMPDHTSTATATATPTATPTATATGTATQTPTNTP